MKALQIIGAGQFRIVDADMPDLQDHQVLVEIQMVSTCPRWDINMMAGRDMFNYAKAPEYPLPIGFPGHEMAGVVKAVGPGVYRFAVGDRVAALEHIVPKGAYAEYAAYREEELIKLPDSITFKQAVSFELLKCVAIGIMQLGDLKGKSVLISGLGPAGILAVQVARLWGASHVVGIDVSESRIQYVRNLGLGTVMHANELQDLRFELGYDCVGAASSVQNVLAHVNEHVVIFGVLHGDITYPEALWARGTKLESYKYRPVGLRDHQLLIDLVVNKGLNTECLQTHHASFADYGQAIELLNRQEAIKAFFFPQADFQSLGDHLGQSAAASNRTTTLRQDG